MLTIRPMTQKDKPAVMAILRATPEFKPFEVDVAEEVIDSYLHDPADSGYFTPVAEVDLSVAGYVCYGTAPMTIGTWEVYWLAVARERRGQGIGRALMTYVENEVDKVEGRMLVLETSSTPGYEKTRRFHRSLGYETICTIPDFYVPGDGKVIMQKRLR